MTTYAAPIDVANAAVLLLGASSLVSLTDARAEARIINTMYEPVVKAALTRHAWTWGKKTQLLAKTGQTPEQKFLYALPADLLNLRYVTYKDRKITIEEIVDGELVVPYDTEIYAHYTWRVPEARWPADFAEAIVTILNGKLVRGLLNDFNEARAQEEKGEQLLRRAMVRDKRQIKGREIDESPRMVRIWYGNRRHGSQA